jgi:shikimate dehydrogenase
MINAKTDVYAILGNPVFHSMSPLIHNSAFKALGLNSCYVAFNAADLKNAVKGIKALGIKGASVTIPHKIEVIKYLDEVDYLAKNIGAVNTIINKDGRLYGTNSDGEGAYKAIIDAEINLSGKKVLIIGSGGASRAVSFTLASKENLSSLVILGRDINQASLLCDDIKKATSCNSIAADIGSIEKHIDDTALIINCSPVGMHPNVNESPVDKKHLKKCSAIFDIVYNPVKTLFLMDAAKAGLITIEGTKMFLNQAIIQFELWTGKKAPYDVMEKVLLENL